MDTVKFIEERNRMCKSFDAGCKGCPAFNVCEHELCCAVGQFSTLDATDQIAIVEAWSSAHPRKTRQDVFLEQYPNAVLDKDGALRICPSFVSGDTPEKYRCLCSTDCGACRQEFWMQEVE